MVYGDICHSDMSLSFSLTRTSLSLPFSHFSFSPSITLFLFLLSKRSFPPFLFYPPPSCCRWRCRSPSISKSLSLSRSHSPNYTYMNSSSADDQSQHHTLAYHLHHLPSPLSPFCGSRLFLLVTCAYQQQHRHHNATQPYSIAALPAPISTPPPPLMQAWSSL